MVVVFCIVMVSGSIYLFYEFALNIWLWFYAEDKNYLMSTTFYLLSKKTDK